MTIKQVTFGQDTIIVGRGAGEAKAWKVALEISRRRKNWHNVYHLHNGDYHKVTCLDGRKIGHVYNAGHLRWSSRQTVAQRAAALRAEAC